MNLQSIILNIRKELHQIPELGFKEIKTSKYITQKLNDFGYNYEIVAKTGVVACKKSNNNIGAIAFRADMDALQIEEQTGLNFSSLHKGMMHACGHDVHMANLLGLAYYLKDKDVSKDIVFIFQPAEEAPGGAKPIIDEGILEKYNIKEIYGFHIWPYLAEGKIGVKSGELMARPGEFDLTIIGKGGHGATPHETIDPIYISSQFISSIQSIISRNIEPIECGVITVGYINGGTRNNVIPEKLELGGTIRAFSDEVYEMIKRRLIEICEGFEKTYNIKMNLKITDFYPAVVNDDKLTMEFTEILYDEDVQIIKPSMAAEDFSFYQREIPGLFFFVGSKNTKQGYSAPLHNPKFNLTDEAITKASEIYMKILERKNIVKN